MNLKKETRAVLLAIALSLLALNFQPTVKVAALTVMPGKSIIFSQVDFTWSNATTLSSNTGQVDVNITALQSSTGISSGYLNIITSLGWVVQNFPVFSGFPYASISTRFQLSTTSGINITSLNAFVDFSSAPVISPPSGSFTTFPVGKTQFNGQGFGSLVSAGPVAPPPPGVVPFILGGLLRVCVQPGHPNVQTANEQCAPAAVANSLDWMRITYGIAVPQPNVLGLGADGSLVGALDVSMARIFVNRAKGNPVSALQVIDGTLGYLAANGLGGLIVKHQHDGVSGGARPGGGNYAAHGMISLGNGAPTANFIINEVSKGEDVELGYVWATGGGHFVEVVGAGTILGVPWIAYKSDHEQTDVDPTDTLGTGFTDFSFLVVANGHLNLVNEGGVPYVGMVVSESVPPHPVGGISISVDKPASSAPYIGLTSTILLAAVATSICVKRAKRRKEKQ
jgi:hypothetical protein